MGKIFKLFPKDTDPNRMSSSQAIIPAVVDRKICAFLNLVYHPNYFVANWYSLIGDEVKRGKALGSLSLRAAVNEAADEAEQMQCKDEAKFLRQIINYLEKHYISQVADAKDDL